MSSSEDRPDGDGVTRYRMRPELFSIGDDFWIETASGERAFKVDGKALRIRKTVVLETLDGEEVFTIEKKLMSLRNQMQIERGGKTVATVKKALFNPLHDEFSIEVEGAPPMTVKGDIFDYDYAVARGDDKVAEVSRAMLSTPEFLGFSIADPDHHAYGVEVAAGEDAALMLAVTVCIDRMTHDE